MYFEELKNDFCIENYLNPHSNFSRKDFLHYDRLALGKAKTNEIYFFFVRRMGTSLVEINKFITDGKINSHLKTISELNYQSFNFILHKGFILPVFSKDFLKGFLELYLNKVPTNHYCKTCNYNLLEFEIKFFIEFLVCTECLNKTELKTRYNYLINA